MPPPDFRWSRLRLCRRLHHQRRRSPNSSGSASTQVLRSRRPIPFFDAVINSDTSPPSRQPCLASSGILLIFAHAGAARVMTAAGLDSVSRGRFELDRVVSGSAGDREGFHGVPFTAPPRSHQGERWRFRRAIWRRETSGLPTNVHYTILAARRPGTRPRQAPEDYFNQPVRETIPDFD
jgi:hypothetical protein